MGKYQASDTGIDVTDARIGIVFSRYNRNIGDRLLDGAMQELDRHGIRSDAVELVEVPGAFEVPLAAATLAETGRFDGIITLGAVVRGDTPHFDYVAGECARGITDVNLEYGIPVGFGVLTVDTMEQAEARAGGSVGNKGTETAATVVEMVALLRRLRG